MSYTLGRFTIFYDFQDLNIRRIEGALHLKSGLAYLGDNRLVAIEALASRHELRGYHLVRVKQAEQYAANCVRVNHSVLIAAGYPVL